MLRLLGKIYVAIGGLRNSLYDRGILKSHSLGARTISIGNITAGGTGKTPLVAYVAELLADAGEKVCILTRGYGRKNERDRVVVSDGTNVLVDAATGGDEPVELAQRLLGKSVVIADADRVAAARWAKKQFGITAFVLDDAFQHRRARRDLDIVCVDATNPRGGLLRESFANLVRADVIIITRADLVESVDAVKEMLQQRRFPAATFVSKAEIVGFTPLSRFENGDDSTLEDLRGLRALGTDEEVRFLAFCALGNPEAFFVQLMSRFEQESMNDEFDLAISKNFPDHYRYTQSDVRGLEDAARTAGVHVLLTTAKDAVKLRGLKFELPCYVVAIKVMLDHPDRFRDLVLSA